MQTRTLTVCDGRINSGGFCEKCWQPAQTTSSYCGRLVETKPTETNTVLAVSGLPDLYKIRNHFVTTLPTGEVTAWNMICWAKDFTRYMDEIIHEAEKAACASGGEATVAVCGLYCVSSYALVYGKPCKEWCGDENCVRKSSEGQP